MEKVSVIVPVYNAEKYIERCLNSIINQTRSDLIELIVINDGSKDNSEEIIKKIKQNCNINKTKGWVTRCNSALHRFSYCFQMRLF